MRRLSLQNITILCLMSLIALAVLGLLSGADVITLIMIMALTCGAITFYGITINPNAYAPENGLNPKIDISLREQAKLAEGFDESIIIINQHKRILYANPAAKTLFPERNVGTTLPNLIHNQEIRTLADETLNGRNYAPVKFQIDKPVQRHFRVMGSTINCGHDDNPNRRALIIFYDITNIIRANSMRADFLANASHELKTPIASLLGYIETLRGHAKDDPEARETFLVIMQQQAERMQRLISDLLSLRKIELVEHMAPRETADLFLATRAAIESLEPLAKARNVKIQLSGPKNAPVIGVQDELVQLVLNLLDNALKFSPRDGTISLELNMIDDWTPSDIFSEDPTFGVANKRRIVVPNHVGKTFSALRIRDFGPGFDREHLPRIGERFYKIADQESSIKRGTGLGLAIVKHIILRHRGGLFVESAKNAGTRFTILLPSQTER